MATNTYVALATQTLASPTASVTFSSIPQGYTDLVLVVNAGTSTIGPFSYQVGNGSVDTGSNYSRTCLYGDGSSAASFRETNQTYFNTANGSTTVVANDIVQFMNYSNTTTNKTILDRNNNTSGTVQANVYLWRSTAAINTIKIFNASGYNLIAGSTFSLYGVAANSGDVSPKATGGAVYSDATYWYHAFTNSGSFVPSQLITADILVIAGGGGGSLGSGGAGGVQLFSSQSVSTTQTVTIGAGGAGRVTGADGTTGAQGIQGGNSQFGAFAASVGGGGGGALSDNVSIRNGGAGGSGGAGGVANTFAGGGAGGAATSGQGFAGGSGYHQPGNYLAPGGAGGAGSAGGNSSGGTNGAAGAGVSTYSSWGIPTFTGHNVSGTVWYASPGQTLAVTTRPNGGGGVGTLYTYTNNALQATGSGGGGTYGPGSGGNGGSGLVIVRYAK